MGKLLSFSGNRSCRKGASSQTAEPNQYVRQSWVRQFSIGKSTMALARQHKTKMRIIENEIRMALWDRTNAGRAA